jgi:hypothetical protein
MIVQLVSKGGSSEQGWEKKKMCVHIIATGGIMTAFLIETKCIYTFTIFTLYYIVKVHNKNIT